MVLVLLPQMVKYIKGNGKMVNKLGMDLSLKMVRKLMEIG
jgi:hypothetical protein